MSRMIRTLSNRLANLLKLGSVARSRFAEATQIVQATMLTPDDVDDMSWFGDMGVAFRLNEGAEIVTAQLLGGNTAAIGTNQRGARPTEKPGGGEVPEGCGGLHYLGAWRLYVGDDGLVYIGGATGSSDFVALAQLVLNELNDIRSKFDAHTHPYVDTGATPSASTTSASTTVMGAAGSVAATKTKAD